MGLVGKAVIGGEGAQRADFAALQRGQDRPDPYPVAVCGQALPSGPVEDPAEMVG